MDPAEWGLTLSPPAVGHQSLTPLAERTSPSQQDTGHGHENPLDLPPGQAHTHTHLPKMYSHLLTHTHSVLPTNQVPNCPSSSKSPRSDQMVCESHKPTHCSSLPALLTPLRVWEAQVSPSALAHQGQPCFLCTLSPAHCRSPAPRVNTSTPEPGSRLTPALIFYP